MANRTDQPPKQPSPFAGLPPGTVVNFDNYGTVWGTDTVPATEALIAVERATGGGVEEWETTDRDGQPLRVVRLADPTFLDTICVFASASRPAVTA
ncbi:hypothetical protein G9272_32180 [Streptomyces asoensis]|uniref:Uncharacterized protein n=1 Tax=Streptomyces asoensis TaxID=249586 RepID=A0A6M4WV26_9ACTN|nr:hypothetical protein [Streptomyces asoensis]QJT04377.1 hypothetical protein G9272_32180 [Streptomyces asoensis]